jgi:hypothetical protein
MALKKCYVTAWLGCTETAPVCGLCEVKQNNMKTGFMHIKYVYEVVCFCSFSFVQITLYILAS